MQNDTLERNRVIQEQIDYLLAETVKLNKGPSWWMISLGLIIGCAGGVFGIVLTELLFPFNP